MFVVHSYSVAKFHLLRHSVFVRVYCTAHLLINWLAFHSTNYPKVKFNINFDITLNDILATCTAYM